MRAKRWFVSAAALFLGCAGGIESRTEAVEVGWVERSVLEKPEHGAFKARYDTVMLDQDVVSLLKRVEGGVDVLVFLGTWCSDSWREVPTLLKIADQGGIPVSRIRLYGLDRTKKSSDGLTDRYRIERVPTFIFLKNGEEIGRITERPHGTFEADMLAILAAAVKQ